MRPKLTKEEREEGGREGERNEGRKEKKEGGREEERGRETMKTSPETVLFFVLCQRTELF